MTLRLLLSNNKLSLQLFNNSKEIDNSIVLLEPYILDLTNLDIISSDLIEDRKEIDNFKKDFFLLKYIE